MTEVMPRPPATVSDARQPVRALVLDMDGLLVNSEPLADAAMVEFVRRHGRTADPDYGPLLLGRRLPDAVALLTGWYGLPGPLDDLVAEFDALRTEMIIGNLTPMPGATELVAFARDHGLHLALATSNRRHQATISLEETGLAGQFDVEVTGDDVARGKPFPDIFLAAARGVEMRPEECVVFEDAPAGVEAAAAAGMRCVFVPSGYSIDAPLTVAPTVRFGTLVDAIPWLEARLPRT